MKAVQITETGAPEVLKYVEVPTPKPGSGEVLVKAHAIGVCMPETLVRKGVYKWMPPLPLIPGIEMGGTVVETGPETSKLKVGQKVFVCAREFKERSGCYAEYIVAREDLLYAVADTVDLDQVAGLANYQVAWHLLNSALNGHHYDSALVVAAAGGVGTALVQLAKAYGKHVIGVVSSAERATFARAQGADEVIDRTRGNVVEETKRLTHGRGVDLVLDIVGGAQMTDFYHCIAPFGLLMLYGRMQGPPTGNIDAAIERPPWHSAGYRHFTMHTMDHWPELRAKCTHDLLRLLHAGTIQVPIYERVPLAEAARAHRIFESGAVMGKLIMKP